MTVTQSLLIIFIILLFSWSLYDEFIPDQRHGTTLLKVPLLRRSPTDTLIFSALVGVLIYNNIIHNGPLMTTWLLSGTILLALYIGWLRQPLVRFKAHGFFYNSIWIDYQRVRAMNLSQDGVLVMQLEKKPLYLRVKNIDDLTAIYEVMIKNQ